jgi:hypothetical protein
MPTPGGIAASNVTQAEILKTRVNAPLRSAGQAGGASQFQSERNGAVPSLAGSVNGIADF